MKNEEEIIGESDGPKAVIWSGGTKKEKNPIKKLKSWTVQKKYHYDWKRAGKTVTAGTHTLEEVCTFLETRYDAKEVDKASEIYRERWKEYRASALIQYHPELLGESIEQFRPESFENQEDVLLWIKRIDAYKEKALEIPLDKYPIDFRLYKIDSLTVEDMYVEIEQLYDHLSLSYSGDTKTGSRISREIYSYYGVSEDDIKNKTKRYSTLLTILANKD